MHAFLHGGGKLRPAAKSVVSMLGNLSKIILSSEADCFADGLEVFRSREEKLNE